MSSGSEHFQDLADNVKLQLQHLKVTSEIAKMEEYPTITEEEFIGKTKVWNKTTTTTPSEVHLGHYKALIAQHEYSHTTDKDDSTNEDGIPLTELRNELNQMQTAIL